MKKLFNNKFKTQSPSPSPQQQFSQQQPVKNYEYHNVEKQNNINMGDILKGVEQPIIKPKHKQIKSPIAINSSKLKCSEILKAKMCKSNAKCMYDYNDYKCKNKTNDAEIITTPKQRKTPKPRTTQKPRKTPNNKSLRKTTGKVFDQLITSFKRIGNEASKDAIILQQASNKL